MMLWQKHRSSEVVPRRPPTPVTWKPVGGSFVSPGETIYSRRDATQPPSTREGRTLIHREADVRATAEALARIRFYEDDSVMALYRLDVDLHAAIVGSLEDLLTDDRVLWATRALNEPPEAEAKPEPREMSDAAASASGVLFLCILAAVIFAMYVAAFGLS